MNCTKSEKGARGGSKLLRGRNGNKNSKSNWEEAEKAIHAEGERKRRGQSNGIIQITSQKPDTQPSKR